MKVCFDYGHGGRDPGASYLGRKESDDNLKLGQEVAKYLRARGVVVDETRTGDQWVPLYERGQCEGKGHYHYFISFHRNAYRPEVGTGAETFVYFKGSPKARLLGEKIQTALQMVGFKNRGVKGGNYYLLRNTKAPALLLEVGFIDNTADNQLFDQKRAQIAQALGASILKALGKS